MVQDLMQKNGIDEQDQIDVYLENLRQGLCSVLFEKVNGDMRQMVCTLSPELVPEDKWPEGENDPAQQNENLNSEYVRVFDTEISEWRSFRIDSVETFEVL